MRELLLSLPRFHRIEHQAGSFEAGLVRPCHLTYIGGTMIRLNNGLGS